MGDPRAKTDASANVDKDPDEWVSGEDPMTPSQRSYLKTLCEQAEDEESFEENLSKAEASKRIDALRAKLKL
jgi:hypothetical protein